MSTPHSFIIVKGQAKALLIEKIDLIDRGLYAIKYKNSPIGTEIEIGDILGFYVWIPRFKYYVINNSNYTNYERITNVAIYYFISNSLISYFL